VATAGVRDLRPALELLDDALQRGKPRRQEVGVVARAEEPLAALEDIVAVLVPADAFAALRGLRDAR
jgi:hypothetical protein